MCITGCITNSPIIRAMGLISPLGSEKEINLETIEGRFHKNKEHSDSIEFT